MGPERDLSSKRIDIKGLPIEVAGRLWAQRRIEEMLAGRGRDILIVRKTKEYERRRALPTLTGEEEPTWNSVWFDEEGKMYISRWPIKKTKFDEDEKRYLVNPRGCEYEVLNRQRLRHDFFENLPKNLPIREVIIDKVGSDIETATRKAHHVLEKYAPGTEAHEVLLARGVIEYTDKLAHRFITTRMTKADLEALARETGKFLEKAELVDPHDPEKQSMLKNLLKVTLKDKLGRYNPLVARVRARAAFLAATRRLVVGGMVMRKFGTIEQILLYERETTRWALQTAANQLGSLLGHADFRRPDGKATNLQRSAIANILFDISEHHFALPRVRAYLAPARYAAINLIGCREHLKDLNRRILGDGVADELFARKPTRILVMEGRFAEAKKRIEESIDVINKVLKEYESIEKNEIS
jgi:hypothetical protein